MFEEIAGASSRFYHRFIDLPFQRQHIVLLEREVIGSCRSVLDIGCGNGKHFESCAPYVQKSVGIDIFPPALSQAREFGIYTETKLMNAGEISSYFPENSFDCVVAFDLVEHLGKGDALHLLKAMEVIASKKVIVFTPNGFLTQGMLNGNIHQKHLSGWSASEMRSLGYHVRGVHGIKGILGEESRPRWRPNRLWKSISVLTQPLCLNMPEWAFQIFCVKTLARGRF